MIAFLPVIDQHLPSILEIYNHYILHTTATFSIEPLTIEEIKKVVVSGHPRFPTFVIVDGEEVIGYVLLARYKPREAYDRTAEVTIYLKEGQVGRGIGKLAMSFIEETAHKLNFKVLLGVICKENEESIRIFEKFGYFQCAHFIQVGEKFGKILDVVIYEKLLISG